MRRRLLLTTLLLLTSRVCLAADPTPDEVAANRALSDRLTGHAQRVLSTGSISTTTLEYSAALLEAAATLDPAEPRTLRLLTEAYLQIGGDEGRDGAVKSLARYLKLEPGDMGAMLRMIRLHYGKMEAADKQREYIDYLLGQNVLAPELRAEIAVIGARLALDRVEIEQAKKYVDQALTLYPLCPGALRLKYEQLDSATPALDRLRVLLNMLRANPAQADIMGEIADELARAGLMDPALNWYMQCFKLFNRMGGAPPSEYGIAYAAELVIADQHRAAEPWIKGLTEQDPTNSDAAFLDLLVARRTNQAERIAPATAAVQKALETRMSRVSDVLNDRQEPGSFDIAADVKKLNDAARLDLTSAYAAALADLAWVKIHFEAKPAEATQYIDPLKQLLAPESVTLARLEGWAFLVDGKKDEARVKLSAVAARDPLSELGMIKLDAAEPAEKTFEQAKKLVVANSSGVMGAMLIESLRDKVGLLPPGPDASALRAELDKFPVEWLNILDISQAKSFYLLKADPVKVAHKFSEPILVDITITNIGKFDITIGAEGTIKPDIWVDVRLTRPEARTMAGVAFDRMSSRLVLRPGESVSQLMRVDSGPVGNLLTLNPMLEIPLYYAMLTNPTTMQGVVPGPGGYRVQFQRVLVRSAAPPNNDLVTNINNNLQNGPGDVRVRTLELLGAYVLAMRGVDNPQAQTKAAEFSDIVRKSVGDEVTPVRAQALSITALLAEPTLRGGVLQQMLSDNALSMQVLGIATIGAMKDGMTYKDSIKPLADGNKDPIVKTLAGSLVKVMDLPPATQPAGTEGGGAAVPPAPGREAPDLPLPLPGGLTIPPSQSPPADAPPQTLGGIRN